MVEQFPRKVFRVLCRRDGTAFIAERQMISRSGSWFVTQLPDGSTEKENGNYWSDTISDALQREAEHVMWRFSCTPTMAGRKKIIRFMDSLIVEAIEWGVLLGTVTGAPR